MQYSIKRFNFRKDLIATGLLTITSEGQTTHLTYAGLDQVYFPKDKLCICRDAPFFNQ